MAGGARVVVLRLPARRSGARGPPFASHRLLDFGFVREVLADSYRAAGRPSIDPELMLRMLLVGYLFGIRSERRLCQEVHLSLAYRWFCRLDLSDAVPHHSTFSENRHGRFGACDLYRLLFEQVVARCAAVGLVAGRELAVEGSTIMAHSSWEKKLSGVTAADELHALDRCRDPLPSISSRFRSRPTIRSRSIPSMSRRPTRRRL